MRERSEIRPGVETERRAAIGTMNSDGRRLLASKAARNFGYGFLSVILGLYLDGQGYSPGQVGAVLTTALIGSALLTALITARGDRFGRRRMLNFSATLMVLSGLVFGLARSPWLLMLAALSGTISPTSGEVGPFETLESAILPQITPPSFRNRAFGLYNAMGAGAVALGALAAAVPERLGAAIGVSADVGYRGTFLLYALLGAIVLILLNGLSGGVELEGRRASAEILPLHRSKRRVFHLASLFALDSFAGGFVVQSFLVYWFALKYGVGGDLLGPVFFGVSLMKTLSYLVAVRIADRVGLLNTMVFSHLPSNLMLMAIPLMPSLTLAVALLILRHALSQMDVPTRAAFIVTLVEPEERTAATGLTSLVRSLAHAAGPALAGVALQAAGFGIPFFLGGGLKVVYDLALYRSFRGVALAGEDSS